MNPLFLVIAVAAGIAVYVVMVYNNLQTLLTQIEASIQEIGNQLKRQASLIPNLESSVKAFLKQEKSIFSMLTEARRSVASAAKSGDLGAIEQAEQQIAALIPKLQVVVEDNPELKSNETIQQFMNELRDTADKVTYARRALIDLTQQFNQMLVVFPTNLVGRLFSMKKQSGIATPMTGKHVEVSVEETEDVTVNL